MRRLKLALVSVGEAGATAGAASPPGPSRARPGGPCREPLAVLAVERPQQPEDGAGLALEHLPALMNGRLRQQRAPDGPGEVIDNPEALLLHLVGHDQHVTRVMSANRWPSSLPFRVLMAYLRTGA